MEYSQHWQAASEVVSEVAFDMVFEAQIAVASSLGFEAQTAVA